MSEVRIFEVSLRDGLQNEAVVVSTSAKLEYLQLLVSAGFRDIEAVSFVRPRMIPQLADAADVVRQLPQVDGVRFWGLVPNQVGMERALDAGIRCIATFLSASETHNQKNVNRTVKESLEALKEVVTTATAHHVEVRSYISTVFGCPYEGMVGTDNTVRLALALLEAGAGEIVLGDTTGMADPLQVGRVIGNLVAGGVPVDRLGVHFHDTRGTALVNNYAAWNAGVRMFDGSVAGIGGCPYAPGAAGNVATEDLLYLFNQMNVETGVDIERACEAGNVMEALLGRALPGRYHQFARAQMKSSARTA